MLTDCPSSCFLFPRVCSFLPPTRASVQRKAGLMKKAWELSVLCGADVSIVIFSAAGKAFEFSSQELDGEIDRYLDVSAPYLTVSLWHADVVNSMKGSLNVDVRPSSQPWPKQTKMKTTTKMMDDGVPLLTASPVQ